VRGAEVLVAKIADFPVHGSRERARPSTSGLLFLLGCLQFLESHRRGVRFAPFAHSI
jgi:hypothetical protein